MAWMTDPHAEKILRGLYYNQNTGLRKVWLQYGLAVLFVGIAAGGTFLKMRPPSAPIARTTPEVTAPPNPTITFPSLRTADLPQMGWKNPSVEKMRWLLKSRPRALKPGKAQHKRLSEGQKMPFPGTSIMGGNPP
jgi:hypothetical protein